MSLISVGNLAKGLGVVLGGGADLKGLEGM